jgi:hypothetical protein
MTKLPFPRRTLLSAGSLVAASLALLSAIAQ